MPAGTLGRRGGERAGNHRGEPPGDVNRQRSGEDRPGVRDRQAKGDGLHRAATWARMSQHGRCCGWAGTSCWSAPTNSACISCTRPCTTWRKQPTTPLVLLAGSSAGSSTRWASAILGLIVGALIVLVLTLTLHRRKAKTAAGAGTDSH